MNNISNYKTENINLKANLPQNGDVFTLVMNVNSLNKSETLLGNGFDFRAFSDDVIYIT